MVRGSTDLLVLVSPGCVYLHQGTAVSNSLKGGGDWAVCDGFLCEPHMCWYCRRQCLVCGNLCDQLCQNLVSVCVPGT